MASVVLTLGFATTASAVPVYCSAVSTNKNYMAIDDSQVKGCLLSGSGNINGNPKKDPFLNSAVGAGYSFVSKSDALNVVGRVTPAHAATIAETAIKMVDLVFITSFLRVLKDKGELEANAM